MSSQRHSVGISTVAFEVLVFNCQIDFINLFNFNCLTSSINFFIFNCFESNFCFLKNFCKQKRTTVYERAFLVLDFKFTRENDELLSSRHNQISEVPHPVHEYTKMGIPTKGKELTRFLLFKILGVSQLWGILV